jgi:glycosyltransferase involved in cell wall biosynthesis
VNVALFAGLDTDHSYSMNRYATGLADALQLAAGAHFSGCFQLNHGRGIRLPAFLGRSRRLQALANEGPATHVLYPRQARRHQADVNHVLDHSYGSLLTALPPQRTVVTCHDLIPLEIPDVHPTLYSQMTGRRWYKKSITAMTRAVRIIAISEHTEKDLVKHTGYDPDHITVIPHGIDYRFRPVADKAWLEQARQSLGLPANCKFILHVGSCAAYKNIPILLKVFEQVRHRVQEPVWLMRVGAPFTASQQHLVEQMGLQDRMWWMDGPPIDDFVALYNLADVLVFPSLYEGLGLPPIEAMACGLPVAASNAASLPEVLGEGQLTFDPDDVEGMAEAVVAIFQNPALRQSLIEKGLRQAQRFSWPRVAEQVLAVYEQVWRGANDRA